MSKPNLKPQRPSSAAGPQHISFHNSFQTDLSLQIPMQHNQSMMVDTPNLGQNF